MTDDSDELAAEVESAFEEVRTEREIMAAREQMYRERGMAYVKCPDCGAVSPNADDIANNYCFRCSEFK